MRLFQFAKVIYDDNESEIIENDQENQTKLIQKTVFFLSPNRYLRKQNLQPNLQSRGIR